MLNLMAFMRCLIYAIMSVYLGSAFLLEAPCTHQHDLIKNNMKNKRNSAFPCSVNVLIRSCKVYSSPKLI